MATTNSLVYWYIKYNAVNQKSGSSTVPFDWDWHLQIIDGSIKITLPNYTNTVDAGKGYKATAATVKFTVDCNAISGSTYTIYGYYNKSTTTVTSGVDYIGCTDEFIPYTDSSRTTPFQHLSASGGSVVTVYLRKRGSEVPSSFSINFNETRSSSTTYGSVNYYRVYDTSSYSYTTTVKTPTAPTKSGKKFKGWIIKGGSTYYPENYTIDISTQLQTYGDIVFIGEYYDEPKYSIVIPESTGNQTYWWTPSNSFTLSTSDPTDGSRTLTFDANGGTQIAGDNSYSFSIDFRGYKGSDDYITLTGDTSVYKNGMTIDSTHLYKYFVTNKNEKLVMSRVFGYTPPNFTTYPKCKKDQYYGTGYIESYSLVSSDPNTWWTFTKDSSDYFQFTPSVSTLNDDTKVYAKYVASRIWYPGTLTKTTKNTKDYSLTTERLESSHGGSIGILDSGASIYTGDKIRITITNSNGVKVGCSFYKGSQTIDLTTTSTKSWEYTVSGVSGKAEDWKIETDQKNYWISYDINGGTQWRKWTNLTTKTDYTKTSLGNYYQTVGEYVDVIANDSDGFWIPEWNGHVLISLDAYDRNGTFIKSYPYDESKKSCGVECFTQDVILKAQWKLNIWVKDSTGWHRANNIFDRTSAWKDAIVWVKTNDGWRC